MNNNLPMNFPMHPMNLMHAPGGFDGRMLINQTPKEERTLYVGNLGSNIDELSLYAQFSSFGKVESMRFRKTGKGQESKGCVFIVFDKLECAQSAQRSLNNSEFMNRELRVYFKKNIRKFINKDSNLIIKNIHEDISQRQLEEECKKFGNVISCYIKKIEKNGEFINLGYGYVQFEKKEDAESFMDQMNGKQLNGQAIEVCKFVPPSERHSEDKSSNLYVKNFPSSFDKDQVEKFLQDNFQKYGKIISQGVFQDKTHNKFYAFVAYEESEYAQKAIQEMNNHRFNADDSQDDLLYVGIAQTKLARKKILKESSGKSNKSLYIRFVKSDVTEQQIKDVFGIYGDLESVFLKNWKVPESKLKPGQQQKFFQFGFINFKDPQSAMKMYCSYKNDDNLKALVDVPNDTTEYVFIPISKQARIQYLKTSMQQKKLKNQMMMGMPPTTNNMLMNNMPMQPPSINMPPPNTQMFPPHNNQLINNLKPHMQVQDMSNKNPIEMFKDQICNMNSAQVAQFISSHQRQFEQFPEEDQKQILGEHMFARIEQMARNQQGMSEKDINEVVPKITGMLIDQEVLELEEILEILDNDETLDERFKEAIEVLQDDEENN